MFFYPVFYFSASGGGTTNGDLSNILSAATQMVTWIVTTMTSVVSFVVDNPVVLSLFLLMLISFAVGIFFRIWRSTGV